MAKKAKKGNDTTVDTVSALSNPFSTGGGGVDFEYRVQAVFLLTLLVEGFSPLLNLPITSVIFQGKRLRYDIDDVILESSSETHTVKLLCQIKHGIKITENCTFKEVLVSAWSDFNKPEFNKDTDKIVLVSSSVANANSLRFIYDQANAASDEKDFIDRIQRTAYSNSINREKLNIIKRYLKEANCDENVSDEQLWQFCRIFTILIFDLDYESSVNEFLIHALISSNCKEDARVILSMLFDSAARYDKAAAHVTLSDIPECITEKFKNVIPFHNKALKPLNFDIDSFFAKLAVVGSWNENNDSDKQFLEAFLGISYNEIQKRIQENSLQPNPSVSFFEGLWHVNHRRSIINTCSKLYFDNDIKKFFELSEAVLEDKDKRIQENGDFSILVPQTGSFVHSEALRSGIIHGLAILCNHSEMLLSCSADITDHEALMLIRNLFKDSSSSVWMSLAPHLQVIAEIHPLEYLNCLERQIINNPKSLEALFPKKTDNLLFSRNFICSVLWSLEGLAWDENLFVQCIGILGLLSKLNFDETNSLNTPVNSIVSIMLPWYIQTLASKDKQKCAIKALLHECPDIAWLVIKGLLPHATHVTGGTYKPRYIISNLPKELRGSDQDILDLYQYYSCLALKLAKESYSKMCDLLSYYDNMSHDTIIEYFSLIIEKSIDWDDSQKYPFWNKLSNKKDWLTHNATETLDDSIMCLLDTVIAKTAPIDIRYSYRKLYDHGCFDYNDEVKPGIKMKVIRNRQENAVYEIYISYGIYAVVEFAKELNQVSWVAHNLGKQLKGADIKALLKMCFDTTLDKSFFSSILSGYILTNDCDAILKIGLQSYGVEYISWVLSCIRPSRRLFEIAEELLGTQIKLYWDSVIISPLGLDENVDLNYVWKQLVSCKRYVAAINLFEFSVRQCIVAHDEVYDTLTRAAISESCDNLNPNAVKNLIELLQQTRSISIEDISNVEIIYLLWLDEHSKVKPLALRYRIANEPQFFCDLIKMMYKKNDSNERDVILSEQVSSRLRMIFHNFCVVPGTDWEGNYNEEVFYKWIDYCKTWAKSEDLEDIVLQTIGNGFSYAKKDAEYLPSEFIMKELNKMENGEMRLGYQLGIINQRGVTWLDPEGKPELQLAKKYKDEAEAAESKGYAKYAELLRIISDNYTKEAKSNIKRHQLEIEARKREEDDLN